MKNLLLLSYLLTFHFAQSQDNGSFQKQFQLHLVKTIAPIKIDGELNDSIWSITEKTTPFWRKFPTDGSQPKRNTEVQMAYDNKFIYIAFTAFDSGKAFINSLKR
ncbi:MAG TPA: hypothetical protein VFN30_12480, partial [Chitinophagaceae bacterium]|nr:hypothetical protein [Chitinophagaceae bacterium]